ncbi:unnamed protein product [Cyberlindnera jadinii]|uniref:Calponin-homology (CH) domain-containing protein n=1 Tax=Cyberlindnera jadinii (strain ATCC 18201 / CBS 1600 / BCRC 20928 / JCM 3617 / NBRC 0987 / NRRL Y-1542) TaxID=983966 RepID=A0A0H5C4E4_CYBJN|nr:unnamed protein product [Cyberlindnera jadinii]
MASPKKSIASRYLDNLPQQSVPLQPSAKVNTPPSSPTRLKTSNVFVERSSPAKLQTANVSRLEESIAGLKLDSPSPLKRGTGNELNSKAQPAPQWTLSNRSSQKGYEYLCRISEAKKWIEGVIGEDIPSEAELATDGLRDGVVLAKLTRHFRPDLVKKIVPAGKLQFKHTENINVFFQFLDSIQMPDLFRFELTDLYDKKDIPKVIFCLHALTFMMSQDANTPGIEKLNDKLNFSHEDIKKSETSLRGAKLPNFDSMVKQFGREIPQSPRKSSSIPPLKEKLTPEVPTTSSSSSSRKSTLQSPFLEFEDTSSPPPFPVTTGKLKSAWEPRQTILEPKMIEETVQTQLVPEYSSSFADSLVSSYDASPRKQKKLSDRELLNNIIRFQSISRGSIFRYNMFIDKIMLKSVAENVVQLQSLVRRHLSLKKYQTDTRDISGMEANVTKLQSIIRGKLQRSEINDVQSQQPNDKTVELQSFARGYLARSKVNRIKNQLSYNLPKIIQVQCCIRANAVFDRSQKAIKSQEIITNFQAHIRRHLLYKKLHRSVKEAHTAEDAITIIQSQIRGSTVRSMLHIKKKLILTESIPILELQSIARAGLVRSKLNVILDNLDLQEPALNKFCSVVKGKLVRSRIKGIKRDLKASSQSVILTQSQVRGVLSRYGLELILDDVDYYLDEVVELQSLIRRYLYQKSKKEDMIYYEQHLEDIIKIQSVIRGKYLGNAYKSLISMHNPPLSVIRKFAYLLNDNDVDFEEEVKLTRLKESINEKTSSNELLEKHISQLDLKIALLQKNKITLDELLLQKNKDVRITASVSTIDVTSLNRRTKNRMELYEKFFYLLQTQPLYLTRLIHSDYRGTDLALKVFHDLQSKDLPTREEYLFIRLVDSLLSDFISKSQSIHDLWKHNTTGWQRLLHTFNETQTVPLRSLFGTMVENVLNDEDLDFESDPLIIYQKVNNTPKILPVDKAIEDESTKQAFVYNLQQLREYGSEIFRIISDNVKLIPIHVRLLAKSAYVTSAKKFPHLLEQDHLGNAGFVLINGYIRTIFESYDKFGVSPLNKATRADKNLHGICKLLTQMFVMKPFGSSDIYLQPLNKFINSSLEGIRSLIKSVIDVSEIDTVYNMTVYDDMTAHKRPKLTLRISDMLSMNQLIDKYIDIVAPLSDDTLREILIELRSCNTGDITRLNGYYTLNLNPSSYRASPDDNITKSLLMQAKRCVLYLVQVQDEYNDLFNLLKSKIDPIDEIKFKRIINAENKDIEHNRVNDYTNNGQGFLGDLTKISYHKLKEIALERILELETMSIVTRRDSFQLLLNEIAHDIRTKHDQRLSRKKQLSIAQNTLSRLGEKNKFLEDQLKAYNHHIDKSMEELQSKPTKPKRILPFTKQFFYERELKKSGKLPKFGAYKYSSKRLYEKGVLVELRGLDQNLNSSGSSFFGSMNFPKVDFMFSCDRAGEFNISCKSSSIAVNGNLETLTIDQFLEYQFENKSKISLFGGMAKFDTNCLIDFIFKKFYHNES